MQFYGMTPWNMFGGDAGDLFGGGMGMPNFMPTFDIRETKDTVIIRAAVPGAGKDDIKIQLFDNGVNISGQVNLKQTSKTEGAIQRSSMSSMSFNRTIPLPCPCDIQRAKATFTNGLLEIKIPKKITEKGKELKIEELSEARAREQGFTDEEDGQGKKDK